MPSLTVLWLLAVLPASYAITSLNSVIFDEQLKKNSNNWLVMFETPWCGKPCEKFHPVLKNLEAKVGNHLNIGLISGRDTLVRRFDIQSYPTLLYLRKGKYYVYTHTADEEDLTLFCAGDYKHNTERDIPDPVAVDRWTKTLDDSNFESSVLSKRGAYWAVLFHEGNYKGYQGVRKHLDSVAEELAGQINVAEIDGKTNPGAFVKLEIKQTPTLFVIRGGKAYRMGDKFGYTFEDMNNFITGGYEKADFTKELKPTSAPLTISNEVDPNSDVVILTDDNFDKETGAMTGKKGTWFVKFYAPWCGHCKMLAPIWEELAHSLRERMHVAKLDCTQNKNSTERFNVPGFPILLLFQGGKYYQYNGELRTHEAILDWAVKGYKETTSMVVPPPFGQPLPPPTLVELLEDTPDFILDSWEFDSRAVLGIVGFGAVTGSGLVMYVALLVHLMKLFSSSVPTQSRNERKNQKKGRAHGSMPVGEKTKKR